MKLPTWGGKRQGSGRKPKGRKAGVQHRPRPNPAGRFPAHVTLRMQPHVYNLRSGRCFKALRPAFAAGCDRFGFRLVHFSVQGNHVHMLTEAKDAETLSRGMQGLAIRMARALNRVMGRQGKVFADRFHARLLKTPSEVKNAIGYVLRNFQKHARRWGKRVSDAADVFSSAGFLDRTPVAEDGDPPPVAGAHSWLLREGWKRVGQRAA